MTGFASVGNPVDFGVRSIPACRSRQQTDLRFISLHDTVNINTIEIEKYMKINDLIQPCHK